MSSKGRGGGLRPNVMSIYACLRSSGDCWQDRLEQPYAEKCLLGLVSVVPNGLTTYNFQDYLPRFKKNKIAVAVKIADSSHNLSKAHLIEDKLLQKKLRNKYIKVLNELGEDGEALENPLI